MVGRRGFYVEEHFSGTISASYYWMGDSAPTDQFVLIGDHWEPLWNPWGIADRLMKGDGPDGPFEDPPEGVPPAPPSRLEIRGLGPETYGVGYYVRKGRRRSAEVFYMAAEPPEHQFYASQGQWCWVPDGWHVVDLVSLGLVEGPFEDPPEGIPPFSPDLIPVPRSAKVALRSAQERAALSRNGAVAAKAAKAD